MATARTHHALPAPVIHAGFSVPQSKSHVLAGVQDAYWSDDEAEDAECPLCLEEMDISDLNFKPCICGYQICRFCWHHIKENLNKRCPACRRVYTDDAVEFKPLAAQDHKRLTQQKKQRERERKDLDALGRRQLANVRVVQRNVVYVVGIGPRFAKEELIPTLRSSEYFGQYGKINKIVLVKRNQSGGGTPVVGVYITYHRREDAARAIGSVDGSPSPGGGRDVMRASYGTTKYCMSFLRSVSCGDHNCMNLHEWGDEKDCFTKEDLSTLKHTMKTTETRARSVITNKRGDDADGLPRSAAWGARPTVQSTTSVANGSSTSRKRGTAATRQQRPQAEPRSSTRTLDRKAAPKTTSQASSRPSTPAPAPVPAHPSLPARPASPVRRKSQKKEPVVRASVESPAPSTTAGGSSPEPQENTPPSPEPRPRSADSMQSSIPSVPSVPPGLSQPTVPPGLSAPPGLPGLSRPPRVDTASPQTPILSQQTTYQMSNAARALLDDVKARRESLLPSAVNQSPFPDFDRTLQNLSQTDGGFGGFSFNLDPKLAADSPANAEALLPDLEAETQAPFLGASFMDAFPALRSATSTPSSAFMTPPGLVYPHNPSHAIFDPAAVRRSMTPVETQPTTGPNYSGSFNPFADGNEEPSSSPTKADDDDASRKVSRFGFARHGPRSTPASASPLQISSTLSSSSNNETTHSVFTQNEHSHSPAHSQWSFHNSRQDFSYPQANSAMASPMMTHSQAQAQAQAQAQSMYAQPPQSRFQPFESGGVVSEAQLRDLIQSSQERPNLVRNESHGYHKTGQPQFSDPAIMSARFAPEPNFMHHAEMTYGPPPGLSFPPGLQNVGVPSTPVGINDGHGSAHELRTEPVADGPSLSSPSDFPALSSTVAPEPASQDDSSPSTTTPVEQDQKVQEKEERKAAKKAAAAAKAAERQKLAQEKAASKAAEKARISAEKAAEREKAAVVKAELEKLKEEKEKLEKEKEKAKAEREKSRLERAEKERIAQAEKEKAAQAEKEKAAKKAAAAANKAAEAQKTPNKRADTKSAAPKQTASAPAESDTQVPLLSKKPKKNKPMTKPIRVSKEEEHVPDALPSAISDAPHAPTIRGSNNTSSNNSRAQSVERHIPTSIEELLEDIYIMNPAMDIINHPFFDLHKINPAAKMPLEYGPLVHALSALSVGGGFANNVPSGSIDNAVSSFQQLLETLTQTISDLLRLLPRTTWDDSSSFDGVLRDMLKGDDFLDEGGEDGRGREDEVAALTLALERRARWMEVQLSKLEELHRDINNAAVRAVLAFNDSGWDRHGFMPRVGNTVRRFESLGIVDDGKGPRPMSADELEKKLVVAKEAAVFAETELREMMEKMQSVKPFEDDV